MITEFGPRRTSTDLLQCVSSDRGTGIDHGASFDGVGCVGGEACFERGNGTLFVVGGGSRFLDRIVLCICSLTSGFVQYRVS